MQQNINIFKCIERPLDQSTIVHEEDYTCTEQDKIDFINDPENIKILTQIVEEHNWFRNK